MTYVVCGSRTPGTLAVRLFDERQLEIFRSWGKCNLHFPPRGSVKYGLIKILRSCARICTIRATTRKTGDKGVTVFHNLDADAISEVYISDSAPCVNRKIVATRKCSWHVCASSLRCQFFSDIFTKNRTPARA